MKIGLVLSLLVIVSSVHVYAQSTQTGNAKLVPTNFTDTLYVSESLEVYQVAPNTWLHISYLETEQFGRVSCNGMIVLQASECYVFDTPASEEASLELIRFLQQRSIQIIGVVATHFHNDCLAGFSAFEATEIPTLATELTNKLVRRKSPELRPALIPIDVPAQLRLGNTAIQVYFPGTGHTADNLVVYFPNDQILFGGCLIKAMGASKGNLSDADESQWSQSVANVKIEFPNAQKIIPGHGKLGGRELLDYTEKLFQR